MFRLLLECLSRKPDLVREWQKGHYTQTLRACTAPPIEPAHLSGPVGGVGLCQHPVQGRNQAGQGPALLRGEHQTTMLRVLLRQHWEIVRDELPRSKLRGINPKPQNPQNSCNCRS
jgi:hypothetical protein